MLKSRNIQIIGITLLIIAAALVTVSAIRPSAGASVDLSWPPRPDFSVLIQKAAAGNQAASDYYERHREMNEQTVAKADTSDFLLRHPELIERAGAAADMSDYSLRHPDLFQKAEAVDSSDYFLRH